jgi:hypothetical protein
MSIDEKLLRFLGTAFLLLRGQSMLENSAVSQDKLKTANEEEPPKPSLRERNKR